MQKKCRILLLLSALLSPLFLSAQTTKSPFKKKVDKGIQALLIYDYFKAKELFYETKGDMQPIAHVGLATIYYRNDNPFHQVDSANIYIRRAINLWKVGNPDFDSRVSYYNLSLDSLKTLQKAIEYRAFVNVKKKNSLEGFDFYLQNYPGSWLEDSVVIYKNSLAYKKATEQKKSSAMKEFIDNYPQAAELQVAKVQYEKLLFYEMTSSGSISNYSNFIAQYPGSPHRREAEDSVYSIATRKQRPEDYYSFIQLHKNNPHVQEAWKKLFLFSASDLSTESLNLFLKQYPDYPNSELLRQEIELASTKVIRIRENGFWGFIDGSGKWVIPPQYESLGDFEEGYALVVRDSKFGFINRSGKYAIPPQFEDAEPFVGGLSAVKQKGQWGFINKLGEWVVKPEFEELGDFNDSLIPAKQKGAYGFINRYGKFMLPPEFDNASEFSDGLALVEKDEKSGYVNREGKIVIALIFDWAENLQQGFARVQKGEQYGVIRKNGTYLFNCEYDLITPFEKGLAIVVKDEKCGIVDTTGKIILPLNYDFQPEMGTGKIWINGVVRLQQGNKKGLVNMSGKIVAPFEFSEIQWSAAEPFAIKRKNVWLLVDKQGKPINQSKYEMITHPEEGYFRVQKKELWGYVDSLGKLAIAPKYKEVSPFKNGYAIVRIGEEYQLINKNGISILEGSFEKINAHIRDYYWLERKGKKALYSVPLQSVIWKEGGFD